MSRQLRGATELFREAKIRFNRAAELDDHGISAAILSGGNFNTHPTFGHVVFVHISFFGAVKANAHAAAERLFAVERAVLINGEVVRWDVCALILGHDGFRQMLGGSWVVGRERVAATPR